MRQYTLKQVVVRVGDVEQDTAGVLGMPELLDHEEHTKGKVREPTNYTGDDLKIITDNIDEGHVDEKLHVEDDATAT